LAWQSQEVVYAMENKPVTINWHHDGVTPDDFLSRPKARDFFRVISLNQDTEGKWYEGSAAYEYSFGV
jgi:hypothetical protein